VLCVLAHARWWEVTSVVHAFSCMVVEGWDTRWEDWKPRKVEE
jgi:hypothetical protein